MKTVIRKPGYLVEFKYLTEPVRCQSLIFSNTNLLMARQSAFQYAHQIIVTKSWDNGFEVNIYLAEFEEDWSIAPYVAQIFKQRVYKNGTIEENIIKQLLILKHGNEGFESLSILIKSLSNMTREYDYYQDHGYSLGFGYLNLLVKGPFPTIPRIDPVSSTDEELRKQLKRLRKRKSCYAISALYDGLPYAISLISQYNQLYSAMDGELRYHTQFVAAHQFNSHQKQL